MSSSSQLARITRLLDAAYPEPEPFDTAEGFARSHHDDIGALSLDAINAERILARLRWATLVHHREAPSAWLLERIARLDREAERRRRPAQRR